MTLRAAEWSSLVLCAVYSLHPQRASAADSAEHAVAPVYVASSTCLATPREEVVDVLRVELPSQLAITPPTGRAYSIDLECLGDRVGIIVVVPGHPDRRYERDLSGAPANVRSRIVALTIAEIVRDLDREPPPPPRKLPPPPVAPVRDQVMPTPPPRVRRVHLGAFGQTSTFSSHGAWLAGGGVRFEYTRLWLAIGADAVFLTAHDSFEQGSARSYLGYGSPYVAWRERIGAFQSRLGGGYALGMAAIDGDAAGGRMIASSVRGVWGAPYALAGFAVDLGSAVNLELRGQCGWVMLPVIGEVAGGADVGLEKLWASVQLGVGLSL